MRAVAAGVAAVALVAGCASRRPVAQVRAEEVVEIRPDRVARCQRLGMVKGAQANGASVAENARYATEDVRRQVARLGGNAFLVTKRTDAMWRSVVDADAYLCPSWEPVPGLAPR